MGRLGKSVLILVVLVIAAAAALFATGMLRFESSGGFDAPEVALSGGDMPQVELETAEIAIGSEEATVDVPRVDVDSAQVEVQVPTIDIEKAAEPN